MTWPSASGRHSATPLRTAATSEWVVPRSMPTAMRRWCGSGAWPGSEIWSNAIALFSLLIDLGLDVLGKALDEHEGSHLPGRFGVVALLVDQPVERGQGARTGRLDLRAQLLERGGILGVVEFLAPRHLLHQEVRRHRRVGLGLDREAVQLAQVGGPLDRILEPLVGFVD